MDAVLLVVDYDFSDLLKSELEVSRIEDNRAMTRLE